jgi:hypothetical protein
MAYGACLGAASIQWLLTPTFLKGTLSDGAVQVHCYIATVANVNNSSILKLMDSSGTIPILEIYINTTGPVVEVWSDNHTNLLGTVTDGLPRNTWFVLTVRCKVSATVGIVEVLVNGVQKFYGANVDTGTTNWGRVRIGTITTDNANHLFTGLTIWTDAADDAATGTTMWMAHSKPLSDSLTNNWTKSAGGTFYGTVDEATFSSTDYDSTTTQDAEIRFGIDPDNIHASWEPEVIYGVLVQAGVRGEGILVSGQVAIDDGGNNDLGTLAPTGAVASLGVSDVFPLQADGLTGWDVASLGGHSYGVKVS